MDLIIPAAVAILLCPPLAWLIRPRAKDSITYWRHKDGKADFVSRSGEKYYLNCNRVKRVRCNQDRITDYKSYDYKLTIDQMEDIYNWDHS